MAKRPLVFVCLFVCFFFFVLGRDCFGPECSAKNGRIKHVLFKNTINLVQIF